MNNGPLPPAPTLPPCAIGLFTYLQHLRFVVVLEQKVGFLYHLMDLVQNYCSDSL